MKRLAPILAVMALVIVASLMFGESDQRRGGPTGDPRSTVGDGARAAVLLLEASGRPVDTRTFSRSLDVDATTLMLFHDDLVDDDRQAIADWVDSGGTLVMFGESVDVGIEFGTPGLIEPSGTCSLAGFDGIEAPTIGVGASVVAAADGSCFAVGSGWFLTTAEWGSGTVVAVSTVRPFLNRSLADDDHGALLVAIAQLGPGDLVAIDAALTGVGGGDQTLADLVGEPVWALLFVMVAAAAIWMLTSGRRLGAPIVEPMIVTVDSFEVVKATARLYDSSSARQLGVSRLRTELHTELVRRWDHGQATDRTIDEWAEVLRLEPEAAVVFRRAFTGTTTNDQDFVDVMAALVRTSDLVAGRGPANLTQHPSELL